MCLRKVAHLSLVGGGVSLVWGGMGEREGWGGGVGVGDATVPTVLCPVCLAKHREDHRTVQLIKQ